MRHLPRLSWFVLALGIATCAIASADPISYPDGSMRYAAQGAGIPVIEVQVGDLCDIQLQAGEKINQAIISDSVRWKMTDGVSGSDVPHVFLKPTDAGLHALLTITTTRRAYHVRVVSTSGEGRNFVGFYYPATIGQLRGAHASNRTPAIAATPSPAWSCAPPLDSRYHVDGAKQFRPLSICNDGEHTYVNMGSVDGPLPVLVVVGDGNQDQIANVSFVDDHSEYILDGVPNKIALLRDSVKGQIRVNIARAK